MTPAELHASRKRLGMTQAQLADALQLRGRDRTRTVRAWEKGEKPITGTGAGGGGADAGAAGQG